MATWGFSDCMACGRGGHWMDTCPYRTQASWNKYPPGTMTRPWYRRVWEGEGPRLQSGLQMALDSGVVGSRNQNQ